MGLSPILSIIHTIVIGAMLNFNNGNDTRWLKKRYIINRPLRQDISEITYMYVSCICGVAYITIFFI